MLAAADRSVDGSANLRITVNVIRNDRLLDPLEIQARVLQHPDHANRIRNVPTHVRVGHQLDVRTNGMPDGANQLQVLPHAFEPVARTVTEPLLHRSESALA